MKPQIQNKNKQLTLYTQVVADVWDHAKCSGNCSLIIVVYILFDFELFEQPSTNHHQHSFDHFGAPGVFKTALACIVHHIIFNIPKPGFNVVCSFQSSVDQFVSLLIISDSGELYVLGDTWGGGSEVVPRHESTR